jgi:Tol biopolymer transport system component
MGIEDITRREFLKIAGLAIAASTIPTMPVFGETIDSTKSPILYCNDGKIYITDSAFKKSYSITKGIDPKWARNGEKITLVDEKTDDVYLFDLQTEQKKLLVENVNFYELSPDQTRIVFSRDKEIYIQGLEDRTLARVGTGAGPRWCDNKNVVYIAGKVPNDLFMCRPGKSPVKIESEVQEYRISPELGRIAIRRGISLFNVKNIEEIQRLMQNPNSVKLGKSIITLYNTKDNSKENILEQIFFYSDKEGYFLGGPAWSPDGKKLVVSQMLMPEKTDEISSQEEAKAKIMTEGANFCLKIIDIESKRVKRLNGKHKNIEYVNWIDDSILANWRKNMTIPMTENRGFFTIGRSYTPDFFNENGLDMKYLDDDKILRYDLKDNSITSFNGNSVDVLINKER